MNLGERLGGRRGVQVGILTAALLVVLAFLAIDTLGRGEETRSVWVMTRSVQAGAALGPTSWRVQLIPAPRDAYSFQSSAPTGKYATHPLSPGDILRPDDLESTPRVSVPVKLGGYQPVAGDLIDVYAVEGGKALLVGRGITVVNAGTIEVPASDEPLWVAIYGNSATLVSTRSNGTGVPESTAVTGSEAIRRLAGLAQGSAPTAP
ncbi:MAG: hypothetical protein NVSMB17_04960 [Candidatus Dormibacteria bacterium]